MSFFSFHLFMSVFSVFLLDWLFLLVSLLILIFSAFYMNSEVNMNT